jgi:hypothetical protein
MDKPKNIISPWNKFGIIFGGFWGIAPIERVNN